MTATVRRAELTAVDHINQLIRPFTTTEVIRQPERCPDGVWRPVTRLHTVTHPALLDQVENTITGSQLGREVFRSIPQSKPAARLDCLAFLDRINRQARELAVKHDVNPAQPLRVVLRELAGKLGDRPHRVVRSWWSAARVLTQHDGAPLAPDAPCPVESCEARGTLRVRLDPNVAVCTECGESWSDDDGRFGRLRVWVEWASEHLRGPRHLVDGDGHGYEGLGYVVVCPECEVERVARAERAVMRRRGAPEKVA